jgi:hypothetical protein
MIKERPKIPKVVVLYIVLVASTSLSRPDQNHSLVLEASIWKLKISFHRPEMILVTILAREQLDLTSYFLDHAGLSKK